MALPRRKRFSLALLAALAIGCAALPAAVGAKGTVGVEKLSRSAGQPGERVRLTIACEYCPPGSFPVSLVPLGLARDPTACGAVRGCPPTHAPPPTVAAAPRRPPFTLLGAAAPPRHLLDFEIPPRRPGVYTFVIFCDACWPSRGGALISSPATRPWRLRIESPIATFGPLAGWFSEFLRTA